MTASPGEAQINGRPDRGQIQIKQRLLDNYAAALTPLQSVSLKRSLAASYFDLGYHLSASGDKAGALAALRTSWRLGPSLRTLLARARACDPADAIVATRPAINHCRRWPGWLAFVPNFHAFST
jgi:hypothetical protein